MKKILGMLLACMCLCTNLVFAGAPIEPGGSGNYEEVTASVFLFSTSQKGDLVKISDDLDMNSDGKADAFRVLSVNGSQYKLLAMNSYKTSAFGSSKTYSGSTLDTEMTNYYNTLPSDVQSAIVAQDIVQSVYNESDPMVTSNRSSENPVGSRYVYALDVDDVISYLGSDYTDGPCTALREMFFNTPEVVSRRVWLRSANADDSNSVFLVQGGTGDVYNYNADRIEHEVRPAFVIDLDVLNGTGGSGSTEQVQNTVVTLDVPTEYTWTAPASLDLVEGTPVSGTVEVSKNVIPEGSKLVIKLSDTNSFTVTSDEGATRTYSITKDSTAVNAGDTIMEVAAGTNNASQALNFAVENASGGKKAGTFKGTANFTAEVK